MKHEGPVYSVAFSADGKQILTAGWDKTIRLWNIETSPIEDNDFARLSTTITSGVFSPDGTKVLTVSDDSTARIWDVASRKQIHSLKHEAGVNSAVFNADGTMVLTACDDSTIFIWETARGRQLNSLKVENAVNNAVFSYNGKLIMAKADETTLTGDSFIYIWNATLTPATPVHMFTYAGISSAVFSADGKKILIASIDGAAHLLDANSGNPIISFKHDKIVNSAVFSPDGKRILTASDDYTARLWDPVTGNQVGSSMKHSTAVKSAVFSPDGKWIVTASWDNAAHLWDAVTMKEIGVAKTHEGIVTSAVFSPDSKWILTAGYDSTVRLWGIAGDLDMPTSLFELQAKATTGVAYNIETGETMCIPAKEWAALKEEYDNRGREHYKNCKYHQYNLWRRFNHDDAGK